ncbi:MAG: prepilin-type N-terminal cleavage/methylation domain-containing protein [Phycisphaerales bacterium]|nr:prepilin-type N-terminal cleavage/methylation domain-containing protein [Phycisphaerales bacterium]
MTTTRAGTAPKSHRGFTLIELLVAVAAGLLIMVGIAQIFATTGTTVATGKRVSAFNRYASILEQRLREDFAAMTRDGYLVIVHQFANAGPTPTGGAQPFEPIKVPLIAGQSASKQQYRRTDEVVFFHKGRFSTARAPLAAGYVAQGNEARIYIGHGAKYSEVTLTGPAKNAVRYPEFDLGVESLGVDPNDRSIAGMLGERLSTNEFASDWSLIRHVTLLRQPLTTEPQLPRTDFFNFSFPYSGTEVDQMREGDRQIAFQPAMPSIFRQVNYAMRQPGAAAPAEPSLRSGAYDRGPWALCASGLFDIATTDLREVRAFVTSMNDGATSGTPAPVFPDDIRTGSDLEANPPRRQFGLLDLGTSQGQDALAGMQAWMLQGLPADSLGLDNTPGGIRNLQGVRMRAEASPPALLETLDPNRPGGFAAGSLEAADRLNDQLMLTSSTLLPRCSAFEVEWSFGLTDASGQTIWYGGSTLVDTGSDGIADGALITPYASGNAATALHVNPQNGRYLPLGDTNGHKVDDLLIHGQPGARPDAPLVSYFGYNDPTYAPQNANDLEQLAWAWPTLIRVTVTLADAVDPSIEQTYQFVFETGKDE